IHVARLASTVVLALFPARRRRQCRQLPGLDQQAAVLDAVFVLKEAARWRAGSPRSVLVVHAAVAGAHEEARLRKPPHGTPKVRAVDRKHLKLLALDAADPTRNMIGIAV